MAVKVPAQVLEALDEIRLSGKVNMANRKGVMNLASQLAHYETVIWIQDHQDLYGRGVFEGFVAGEEVDEDTAFIRPEGQEDPRDPP